MWTQYIAPIAKMGLGIYSGQQGAKAVGAATNIQAGQAGENAGLSRDLAYRLNPYIQQNAEQWGQHVSDVYGGAADYVTQTAGEAAAGARGAAQRGVEYMNPYMQAGGQSTQQLLDSAGRLLTGPQEQFQFSEDDPSYRWRLQQGSQALERSAAARGGLASGNTLKALTGYGQGMASTEYQAAFDRFMNQQKFRLDQTKLGYDTLSGLAQRGLTAGQTAGEFGLTGEKYAGDWTTQGAETAGRFRGRGGEYLSDTLMGAQDKQIANIFAGENQGMKYLTDRAKFLAGGQIGQEAQQQAGLQQAYEGFNDLMNVYNNRSKKPKAGGTNWFDPNSDWGKR